MISSSIRAWNASQNRYPSIFLYQKTPTGIFSITDVEAEVTEDLLPLELLCLQLTDYLEKITRIEVHALSGVSIEVANDMLHDLQLNGLIKLTEYDAEKLHTNIEKLSCQLGDDWLTPHIKEISGRALLQQFQLTEEGKQSVNSGQKTIRKNVDLNLAITGTPFYLFYDTFDLKSDGYELISMDRNLVKYILGHAESHAEYTGIKPLSIGASSVTEGKEVSHTNFWITLEGDADQHIDDVKYAMYLSSPSFDRWNTPPWNDKLRSMVPDIEYVENFVIKSMSETWMMVEDVIEEGLSLAQDKLTWKLEADLEMQKLIFNVMKEPINDTQAEITLRLANTDWNVVILVQLEPWDDLAYRSLRSGRFHARVSRKGFTLEEGYIEYQEMLQEWDRKSKRSEYLETLDTLVENNCLIERLPKVNQILVDVDDVLREKRRDRQDWQFNRLREIEKIMEENNIENIKYFATSMVEKKIDEPDSLKSWIDDGKIEIIDNFVTDVPEIIQLARQNEAHYLGSKKINRGNQEQEYARTLSFRITKKRFTIPGLEPFYDWRMENLFEKMYNTFYE